MRNEKVSSSQTNSLGGMSDTPNISRRRVTETQESITFGLCEKATAKASVHQYAPVAGIRIGNCLMGGGDRSTPSAMCSMPLPMHSGLCLASLRDRSSLPIRLNIRYRRLHLTLRVMGMIF